MNRSLRSVVLGLIAVLTIGSCAATQADPENGRAMEDRLVQIAERLRLGLSIASVAAYSPTLGDVRLHAQQLVNLLEGAGGAHYVRPTGPDGEAPGLLPEIVVVASSFAGGPFDPDLRPRLVAAAKNARVFLDLALDAALSSLEQRRLDRATQDMLRVYAFLAAAYEKPCDTPYVPALWTILRAFDLVDRAAGGNDEP